MLLIEVETAYRALQADGLQPTISAIRARLGYGSRRDILEHLHTVQGQHAAADTSADEMPADEPNREPEADDMPVLDMEPVEARVQQRELALHDAEAKHATLLAACALAEADHDALERDVRTLEKRLVNEEPVLDQLKARRQERYIAHLRIGDLHSLVPEAAADVATAQTALALAQQLRQLAEYNQYALARRVSTQAIEAAVGHLVDVVQAALAHDALQASMAEALGIAELLNATPFIARPKRHSTGYGLVNFYVWRTLGAVVPAPHSSIINPPIVPALAAVDAASQPLSWTQLQAVQAARTLRVQLLRQSQAGSANYVNLFPLLGIPGILTPVQPVALSLEQWQTLLAAVPHTAIVDQRIPEPPPLPGETGEARSYDHDGSPTPPVWAGYDYSQPIDLDAEPAEDLMSPQN